MSEKTLVLIWSQKRKGKHYEVRGAGCARRLYTDGVLHSAYHPDKPLTGSIWDLLLLPALFHPLNSFKRILVLGAGAGGILHLLNRYLQPHSIVAIDSDATHLSVARRFFNINFKNVSLIHADAIDWARNYEGERFDLVIEDLFIEKAGLPARLMHGDREWLRQILGLCTTNGLLIVNHGDILEARETRAHLPRGKMLRQFSLPLLQNRVVAFPAIERQALCFERNIENLNLNSQLKKYSHRILKTNA